MSDIHSKLAFFLFALPFILTPVATQSQANILERASAEELSGFGWKATEFSRAHAHADTTGTAAYMLVENGKIIDSFGDMTHKYRCHSIRKSFLSALYGIYIEKGIIDTSQTLFELGIDEYVTLTPQEQTATVRQLIMGRSGVFLPATYENEGFDKVRPERGSHQPGEHWFYSNWDFNTAGVAFMLETGENIFTAFKQQIAEPIGMRDFELEDCKWRYSPRSQHPAYLFRMSTRDMARFGLLFLNGGKWNDEQLIPKNWVEESTAFHSDVTRPDGAAMPGVGFGYMWWTSTVYFDEAGLEIGDGAFNAAGTGTQAIYVMPEENRVFVHRVNTDLPSEKYQSVGSQEIWKLLKIIYQARK